MHNWYVLWLRNYCVHWLNIIYSLFQLVRAFYVIGFLIRGQEMHLNHPIIRWIRAYLDEMLRLNYFMQFFFWQWWFFCFWWTNVMTSVAKPPLALRPFYFASPFVRSLTHSLTRCIWTPPQNAHRTELVAAISIIYLTAVIFINFSIQVQNWKRRAKPNRWWP